MRGTFDRAISSLPAGRPVLYSGLNFDAFVWYPVPGLGIAVIHT